MADFEKVKEYLLELDYEIKQEDLEEEIVLVNREEEGITNLMIDCEDPILIIELLILELKEGTKEVFESLLKKNREIIHGAFVLDESGTKVLFRDTLELENLDLNELEATLNSLALLLSEFYNELIEFSKN